VVGWQVSGPADGQSYTDTVYQTADGIAKITINRPEVRDAYVAKRAPDFGKFPRRP
jgi:1,4-dihydroxy-2-naphthoyl-CoA synthase